VIRPKDNETYQDLLKQSKAVVEMFCLKDNDMQKVTRSMYRGATAHLAHSKSFFDIASIGNPSDVEGLSGEPDSDGGDVSERVAGLSTLISNFR
jgi:hypothetical protein